MPFATALELDTIKLSSGINSINAKYFIWDKALERATIKLPSVVNVSNAKYYI